MEGAIVTTDAMGSQIDIARTIIEQGAYYVLALKDNHARCMVRCNCFSTTSRPIGSTTSPLSIIPPSTPLTVAWNVPLLAHIGYRVLRCKGLVGPKSPVLVLSSHTSKSGATFSHRAALFLHLAGLLCCGFRPSRAGTLGRGKCAPLAPRGSAFVKTIVAFAKTMAHKIWRSCARYGAESIATRIRP